MGSIAQLDELQLDALREITHIGMQNAATSLSHMVGRTVDVSRANIDVMQLADIPDLLASTNSTKSVYLGLQERLSGSMVFIFEEESQELLQAAKDHLAEALKNLPLERRASIEAVQEEIRITLRRFFKKAILRRPEVVPVVVKLSS